MAQTHDGNPEKTTIADLDTVMISNSENNFTGAKWTGATIKSYAGTTPASSLTPGTQSIAHFDKVEAAAEQSVTDSKFDSVKAFPYFFPIPTVSDGTQASFYLHPGSGTYTLGSFRSICTSGTVTLDIKLNGSTITGLGSIAVSSTASIDSASATTTITDDDLLEFTFTSNAACIGFRISSLFTKTL